MMCDILICAKSMPRLVGTIPPTKLGGYRHICAMPLGHAGDCFAKKMYVSQPEAARLAETHKVIPNDFGLGKIKEKTMHYRNGREAKNGDVIVSLGANGKIEAVGVLYGAVAGNDFCNGNISPVMLTKSGACMCDCLLLEDVAKLISEAGLAVRPNGM